ncbi:hemagglutinin repeat-containing protein [Haemophilus haemoglobinophilus]|nr:hemagglutinin repeat-containing protein [Canicola haemoglobinophilus]
MKTDVNAGENSDINVVGSYISGKKSTALSAENAINLLAKEQHHQERSKNKSSGFNAGVAVSYGSNGFAFGITAGGNYGKGYGNGDETSWLASKVGSLQSQTSLSSQQETNIKGSQVLGNKINLKAQNLNIESLQDTMTYKGKQMNVSGQVTVGYGFSASGSYNQSKVNADYASVKTQAGLFAGDEGFDVEVKSHTDLKGAVITSTSQAEQQNKNRFSTGTLTYSDIENHSSHNASGFGLSGGVTVSGGDAAKEVGGVKLKQIGQNHKDGSSKVEFGGVAGFGSQGNWGIAKGLATALAGYVNDKGSENGYTTSAITTSNIQIQDNQAQQSLTGKTAKQTAEEINRTYVHQDVNKTDVTKVRSDLEQDLAIAGDFVDKLSDVGDEIYYRIEKNEDNIFVKKKRESGCESVECINYRELDVDKLTVPKTKEEALALVRMYAHGIMNTNDQDRLAGSIQYGGKDYLENDVLVVRKPYSSIGAELVFTVFERFRAGLNMPSIFGASNASREQTKIWGLLEQYNKNNPDNKVDLKHLSHSLGVSSTKNAMNWASYKDMKFDNTRLEADTVGTSYPMRNNTIGGVLSGGLYDQGYTEKASELFKNGYVEYSMRLKMINKSLVSFISLFLSGCSLLFYAEHYTISSMGYWEHSISKENPPVEVYQECYDRTLEIMRRDKGYSSITDIPENEFYLEYGACFYSKGFLFKTNSWLYCHHNKEECKAYEKYKGIRFL